MNDDILFYLAAVMFVLRVVGLVLLTRPTEPDL
jgi:hypothetical protein